LGGETDNLPQKVTKVMVLPKNSKRLPEFSQVFARIGGGAFLPLIPRLVRL